MRGDGELEVVTYAPSHIYFRVGKCIPNLPVSRVPMIIVYRNQIVACQWGAEFAADNLRDRHPESRTLLCSHHYIIHWQSFSELEAILLVLSISQRHFAKLLNTVG